MWKYLAQQLHKVDPTINVGFIDCSKHNGIMRTFNIYRFPTILFLSAAGNAHEFRGRRGIEELVEFASGGYQYQMGNPVPADLYADLTGFNLFIYTIGPPIWAATKFALPIAVGLTLTLKLIVVCLVRRSSMSETDDKIEEINDSKSHID